MKLWALLSLVILFQFPSNASATYLGCDYVCHTEITWKQIEIVTYKLVKKDHKPTDNESDDLFDDFPAPSAGYDITSHTNSRAGEQLHDCKDYREWDNIVSQVKDGSNSKFKVVDNKLYSSEGKRYLRCNDPNNTFAKYLEKYPDINVPKHLGEYIPVVQLVWVSFTKWVCEFIPIHHPDDPCHPNNPEPVPESPTMALFGLGLLIFIFIYIKRKRDGR